MNRRFGRLLSGYMLSVIMTAAVGLASMPVVIATAGAEVWAAISVGQAVGLIAGAVVAFGWPVVGPAQVAAADAGRRAELYSESLLTRTLLFLPAAGCTVIYVLMAGGDQPASAIVVIASLVPVVNSLGSAWFFVGESAPWRFNLLDVLPRVAGTIVAIVAIIITGDIMWFVCIQLAAQCLAVALSWRSIRSRYGSASMARVWKSATANFGQGLSGFLTSIVTTTYQNAPLLIVGALLPSQVVPFAMADRIYRLATLALVPVTQVAQGYVPAAATPDDLQRRARTTIRAVAGASTVAAAMFAVLAPSAAMILSAGAIQLSGGLAVAFGIALGCILVGSVVGRACLVALGRARTVALGAIIAAAVGVPLTFVAAKMVGIEAAAASLAAAEAVGSGFLLVVCVRALRRVGGTG